MLERWMDELVYFYGTCLRKLARIIAPLWGQRFEDPE